MFSRILIRLIDQAIIPAILLLATRIVSIVLISQWKGIDFSFNTSGFIYSNPNDFTLINSYSAFAMVVVLTIGIFYILLKSLAFHETHVSPALTARLFSLRLSSFIQTSFDLYSQGTIWLSYSYFLTMVVGLMVIFKFMYSWVFFVSLVLTLISTVLLVLDIENELGGS